MSSLRHGSTILWFLIAGILCAVGFSIKLLADTAQLRYERDVTRMVFNDNVGLLDNIRARLGIENDSMQQLMRTPGDSGQAYLVVSIADKHLWYKRRDTVLFEAPVATASGKVLVSSATGKRWRFETPRGRLPVIEKEESPAWVPPDWHYIELAHKRGLGVTKLERGQTLTNADGSSYRVQGSSIVRVAADGTEQPLDSAKSGKELVVNGNVVIPPFGTIQRRYGGTLGTRRLKMPDGYAIHGTDNPASIGTATSHGCIRMRNEDIEQLYPMVPVGTPVYIY